MTRPENANYLLVDGVLRPNALIELFQLDQSLEVNPLYIGGRWHELHRHGPILVKLSAGNPILSAWLNEPRNQGHSSVLYSTEPLQVVANHLKNFICPPDATGGNGLLRFADPLVTHFWLSSYSDLQLSERLGPLEYWSVVCPTHSWQPLAQRSWHTFTRTQARSDWNVDFAFLDHPQLSALEQGQRWQLEERFFQWLSQRYPTFFDAMDSEQTSHWLHTTLERGLGWGLISERGLIIWAEISIEWGSDFADRADGLYHAWLILDPEHPRLAPELRIEALDNYRQSHQDTQHG